MGKVAEIKTKENEASVEDFLNGVKDEQQRKDSFTVMKMMEKATKTKAKMWGASMIGFGNVRYKSPKTGREVDWFRIGFSPRKANLSLYVLHNMKTPGDFLKKIGKHKAGGGCLYINKLEDVDMKVLEQLINASAKADPGK